MGVCAVISAGCVSPALTPRAPTPGRPALAVMTYNVHLHRYDDPATVRAILAPDADIVCLREVSGGWARVIEEELRPHYPHVALEPGGSSGVAILSRHPLTGGERIEGGRHPAYRIVAHTPLGPVQVVSVHLRPVFTGRGDPMSSWAGRPDDHVAQLRNAMQASADGIPTIVLGDFNEGPDGAAITWLERRGFRNALPAFRPGQPTWRHPSPGGQLDAAIDHVLFDHHLVALDAWTERRGRSDHLPVIARFELAQPLRDSRAEEEAPLDRIERREAHLSLETQGRVARQPERDAHR